MNISLRILSSIVIALCFVVPLAAAEKDETVPTMPKEVLETLKKNGWTQIKGEVTVKDKMFVVTSLHLQADKNTGAITLTSKRPGNGGEIKMLVCNDPGRNSTSFRTLDSATNQYRMLYAEKGYGMVVSSADVKVFSPDATKTGGQTDLVSYCRQTVALKPEHQTLPLTVIFDGEKIQHMLGDKVLRTDKSKTSPGDFLVELTDVTLLELPKCVGK